MLRLASRATMPYGTRFTVSPDVGHVTVNLSGTGMLQGGTAR